MKKLASKTKLFIFVGIFAAIVLAGSIVLGVVGPKLSVDYAGGSKIKIICQEKEEAKKAQEIVTKVLNKNKIQIESVSQLSSGAETRVVFVSRNKNISNEVNVAVREAVSEFEFVEVQGFDSFGSSFHTKGWVIAVVAISLGVVTSLACYFVSKKWSDVIAYFVSYVAMALLSFAVLVITRVELSATSLAGLFVGLVLEAIMSALLLVRFNRTRQDANFAEQPLDQVAVAVRKKYILRDMFAYIAVMIASIVCVALGASEGVFFGVALVLTCASTVFVSYFLLLDTRSALEIAFEARYQKKMSNTSAPVQENKPEASNKSKAVRPQATASAAQKTKAKKRKRRNRQDKVVV